MSILVTGGAGFIGSHVVEALVARGDDVRVLDALLPSAHPDGMGDTAHLGGAEFIHGDVRDPATVDAALRGVTAVLHQAGMVGLGQDFGDAPDYVAHNDLGTAVLLAGMARAGVTTLVLASSMVVYGEGRYICPVHGDVAPAPRVPSALAAGRFEPPCPECGAPLSPGFVDEDARLDPRNVYAATKVSKEYLAACWAREIAGRTAILRYHNVYGPRMPRDTPYAGVASIFRSALARGEAPRVFEDGGQRRDFIHVRDIAEANLAALSWCGAAGPQTARAFNVATGTPHTVGEMAAALADAYGGPSPVVTGGFRLGDVRHVTASSRRITSELGWSAREEFTAGMREFASAELRAGAGRPLS